MPVPASIFLRARNHTVSALIDVSNHSPAGGCIYFDLIFGAILVLIFDIIDVDALKNAAVVSESQVDIIHIKASGGLFPHQFLQAELGGGERFFPGNADRLRCGNSCRNKPNSAEQCGCQGDSQTGCQKLLANLFALPVRSFRWLSPGLPVCVRVFFD